MATTKPRDATTLAGHGIAPGGPVLWNPTTPVLYEHALLRAEGRIAHGGPLVVDTGVHTGRSPKDKFVVREPGSEERVWWGDVNRPLEERLYDGLRDKVTSYLAERDLYVVDAFAGADPAHRISVRVVTDRPYHALFARTMFIVPSAEELAAFEPQAVVLHAPGPRPTRRPTARGAAPSSCCTRAGRRC
jgi:phosphoenolpyruvate carboxykinase (ATP)